MKNFFVTLLFCVLSSIVYCQETFHAVKSSINGGRFEIVQSDIARRQTFKIDKYTGKVYVYVKTRDETKPFTWEKVYWIGDIYEKPENPNQINYQLFLGGKAISDCILINIYTGKTWLLFTDSETEQDFFSPIYE